MSPEHAFNSGDFPTLTDLTPDDPTLDRHDQPHSRYDQVVIFRNPKSRRANIDLGSLHDLERTAGEHNIPVIHRETQRDRRDNIHHLLDTITPDSLIAVRAGDGGLSDMLEAIHKARLKNSVLAMDGGTKNDIATELAVQKLLKDPRRILFDADPTLVRPLVIGIEPENGQPMTLEAFGYASLGISGIVAQRVNRPEYRASWLQKIPGGRPIAERAIAAKTFAEAKPFYVTPITENGLDTTTYPTLDFIAANIGHMAGSLRPKASIHEANYRKIHARSKLGALGLLGAMSAGTAVGEIVSPEEVLRYYVDIPKGRETYVQVDGEQHWLPHDLGRFLLTISTASTGVNMLGLAA